MGKKRGRRSEQRQTDLFADAPLFPVRHPAEAIRPVDLSLRIKTAMGQALKECVDSAAIVAAKMSALTGREISVDALYAYTAASKPDHDIGIVRFVAFVRATKATWLFDLLVHDEGLVVMAGREAHLAQLGLLRQQHQQSTAPPRRAGRRFRVRTAGRRTPRPRARPRPRPGPPSRRRAGHPGAVPSDRPSSGRPSSGSGRAASGDNRALPCCSFRMTRRRRFRPRQVGPRGACRPWAPHAPGSRWAARRALSCT